MKKAIIFLVLIWSISTYSQDFDKFDSIISVRSINYLNLKLGETIVNENIKLYSIEKIWPYFYAIYEVKTKYKIDINHEGRNTIIVLFENKKQSQLTLDTLQIFCDVTEINKCILGQNCKLLIGKDKAIEIANNNNFTKGLKPWEIELNYLRKKLTWEIRSTTLLHKCEVEGKYYGKFTGADGELFSINPIDGTTTKSTWTSHTYP